jgi:hypothetical protein
MQPFGPTPVIFGFFQFEFEFEFERQKTERQKTSAYLGTHVCSKKIQDAGFYVHLFGKAIQTNTGRYILQCTLCMCVSACVLMCRNYIHIQLPQGQIHADTIKIHSDTAPYVSDSAYMYVIPTRMFVRFIGMYFFGNACR